MLFRFSLYGFLKNQRYFEPFLYLALLQAGLSYFVIGLLIGFREIVVNAMEIPSGALADVYGRRRCMILSFVTYTGSFVLFGFAEDAWMFFVAMFFFAIGESFRTGTHKAMIFTWLRRQGREGQRTRVYGYTRSWSKTGSAVSVVIAAGFVFLTEDYALVFFASAVPAAANIINFLGYPRELDHEDGEDHVTPALKEVGRHVLGTLKAAFRQPPLRRLVLESMGYEGVFHSVKDYLQPVVQAAAVAWLAGRVAGWEWSETQQSSVLIGVVYAVLYALSALASRKAHRVSDLAGGEERAARWMWLVTLGIFAALGAAACFDIFAVMIVTFVALHAGQNVWRPILVSRFDACSEAKQAATVLSIESQARRGATMVFAPLVGLAVDAVSRHDLGGAFWPIGALGAAVALLFVCWPGSARSARSAA